MNRPSYFPKDTIVFVVYADNHSSNSDTTLATLTSLVENHGLRMMASSKSYATSRSVSLLESYHGTVPLEQSASKPHPLSQLVTASS